MESDVSEGDRVQVKHIQHEDTRPEWVPAFEGEVVNVERTRSGRVDKVTVEKDDGETKEVEVGSISTFEILE